jgi:hypothetical protein
MSKLKCVSYNHDIYSCIILIILYICFLAYLYARNTHALHVKLLDMNCYFLRETGDFNRSILNYGCNIIFKLRYSECRQIPFCYVLDSFRNKQCACHWLIYRIMKKICDSCTESTEFGVTENVAVGSLFWVGNIL